MHNKQKKTDIAGLSVCLSIQVQVKFRDGFLDFNDFNKPLLVSFFDFSSPEPKAHR